MFCSYLTKSLSELDNQQSTNVASRRLSYLQRLFGWQLKEALLNFNIVYNYLCELVVSSSKTRVCAILVPYYCWI